MISNFSMSILAGKFYSWNFMFGQLIAFLMLTKFLRSTDLTASSHLVIRGTLFLLGKTIFWFNLINYIALYIYSIPNLIISLQISWVCQY